MDATLNDLPSTVREIAEVIGRSETLRLIGRLPRCWAGSEGSKSQRVIMYVPKRLTDDHRLVSILGPKLASRLVEAFGGEILYPANCHHIEVNHRNRRIVELLAEGLTAAQVAEEFGVSVRYVRFLKKKGSNEKNNSCRSTAN